MSPDAAKIIIESLDDGTGGKSLYMQGIFIQGDKRNQNQRIYPVNEITSAVKTLKEKINGGFSVLGEADHPDDLNITIDRVSHAIVDMNMRGNDGIGKLKLLPTPMGNICKTLLESGVKLGVSSRGSGNVDGSGNVSEFEIVTVDIVANPSAPDAYPDPIYEQIMGHRRSSVFWDVAQSVNHDHKAKKYLKEEMIRFIQDLGRK